MTWPLSLLTEPVSDNPTYLRLRRRIDAELPAVIEESRSAMLDARKLPDPVVAALRNLGVFGMARPADLGGLGLTSPEQNEIVETISRLDASVGWCVMIGIDSGIYAGYLEEHVAAELLPRPDMVTAGWIHPQGVAVRRGDTIELRGIWQFGSGIDHADLIMAGLRVYESDTAVDTDGPWEWRVAAASPGDFEILDTWHTTGLEGSGSRHYTTRKESLTIPVAHTLSFDQPYRSGALYTGRDAILRKMSGVPIGVATTAVTQAVLGAAPKYEQRPAERAWLATRIGSLVSDLYTVRSAVYASLQQQWEIASDPDRDEELPRAILGAALTRQQAFQVSRAVAREVYDLSGARAVYKNTAGYSIDQIVRDLDTAGQHAVAQTGIRRAAGELLLTGDTDNPFLVKDAAVLR